MKEGNIDFEAQFIECLILDFAKLFCKDNVINARLTDEAVSIMKENDYLIEKNELAEQNISEELFKLCIMFSQSTKAFLEENCFGCDKKCLRKIVKNKKNMFYDHISSNLVVNFLSTNTESIEFTEDFKEKAFSDSEETNTTNRFKDYEIPTLYFAHEITSQLIERIKYCLTQEKRCLWEIKRMR